jgi:hypothetical protein
MTIKDIIRVGNIVLYNNIKYLVLDYDYIYGGNSMRVGLIKLNKHNNYFIKFVKFIYDEEIDKCQILK